MVLLVEPNYNNKYPPMGLMKISSYHKSMGDSTIFVKGIHEPNLNYDRIYITTLFTFDYDVTLETILYYAEKYECEIYVGGIMSSLLTKKLIEDIACYKHIIIVTGQIDDSDKIGYNDNANVDLFPLDYSILSHIVYKYKESDGYMGYTTRGCVNSCKFCAVPKLESTFKISNNLTYQINNIISNHGEKKNLLLLDNNILGLSLKELEKIVDEIVDLGFGRGAIFYGKYRIDELYLELMNLIPYIGILNNTIKYKLEMFSAELDIVIAKQSIRKERVVFNVFKSFNVRIKKGIKDGDYDFISSDNFTKYYEILKPYYSNRRGALRKVDFNQGLDARLLSEEKMKVLSKINIDPFRLALDDVNTIPQYVEAVKLASRYGVKSFSNYLLYNYLDKPEDLYTRMKLNKDLANDLNVNIYSFPMKYAPINDTNRNYVGKYWNKLILSNYRRILKPTMGIVGKGNSYFKKAFGENFDEFFSILHMPGNYVTFRNENVHNILSWNKIFDKLSEIDRKNLVDSVVKNKIMSSYDINEEL